MTYLKLGKFIKKRTFYSALNSGSSRAWHQHLLSSDEHLMANGTTMVEYSWEKEITWPNKKPK
jgi:hypothetical protein